MLPPPNNLPSNKNTLKKFEIFSPFFTVTSLTTFHCNYIITKNIDLLVFLASLIAFPRWLYAP